MDANGTLDTQAMAGIEYHYSQARIQAGGRGMLGFKMLSSIDLQTDVETRTTYRQDWPFIGHPLTTEVRLPNDALLSQSTNVWSLVQLDGLNDTLSKAQMQAALKADGAASLKSVQPYLVKSIEQTYDLNAAETQGVANNAHPLSTLITETTYDDWGNPNTITQQQYDGEPSGNDWLQQTETTNVYEDPGYNSQKGSSASRRFGRLTETVVITERKGTDPDTKRRRSTFDYHDATGLLEMEKIHYLTNGDSGTNKNDNPLLNLTTTYHHDAYGNVILTEQDGWNGDAMTPRTATSQYEQGRYMVRSHNHHDQLVSEVVDRNDYGVPTKVRDILGQVADTAFTPMGRQYWSQSPGGGSATTELSTDLSHCPAGTVYVSINRSNAGSESRECFDVLGRSTRTMAKAFDGVNWNFQDVQYDILGRVLRRSEPYQGQIGGNATHWTEITYDILGRAIYTTLPDQSTGTVDYHGFVTTHTNAFGHTRTETVNALGETVEVKDNLGQGNAQERGHVTYAYDALGNLTRMTQHVQSGDSVGSDIVSTITYDNLSRKIAMQDPDKGSWTYEYNAFGELISQTSANQQAGVTTAMSYDVLGRMSGRIDYRIDGQPEGMTAWYYNDHSSGNSAGQLEEVEYLGLGYQSSAALGEVPIPDYRMTYAYDALGRQIRSTTVLGDNGELGTYHQSMTYDHLGRPFQTFDIAPNSNHTGDTRYGTQLHYNGVGYPNGIEDVRKRDGQSQQTYHQVLAMNARGQITHEVRGTTQTYRLYDEATGRLCYQGTRKLIDAGSAPTHCADAATYKDNAASTTTDIQDLFYTWDVLGNLEDRTETSGSKNLTESFAYDKLNRLTQANVQNGPATVVTYDSLGNITSKTGVGSYSYGLNAGPHAVTQAGGATYVYDANGNNTTGDGRTLQYTSFDKPYKLTRGEHTTAFAYGPGRSRFMRWDGETTATVDERNTSGILTLYVAGNEYREDKTNGTLEIKRYIAGAMHTLHFESSADTTPEESLTLIFADHLGSTDVITDTMGTVVQEQSFNPWGERRSASTWQDEAVSIEFLIAGLDHSGTTKGFTGHEMLDEIGIIHMNGRIYDARLGRFLQADPYIQEPTNSQSLNRYAYTLNNPLNATDPSGYFSLKKALGIAIGIAAAWITGGLALQAFGFVSMANLGFIGNIAAAWSAAGALAGVSGTGLFFLGAAGAAGGFAASFSGAAVGGANFSEAFSAGLQGALQGGIFGAIGGAGLGPAAKVGAHSIAGSILADLQGGKFGHGFLSAGLTKISSKSWIGNIRGSGPESVLARTAIASIVGGTVSRISGGKFANGAQTAAFAHFFNQEVSNATNLLRPNNKGVSIKLVGKPGCKTFATGAICGRQDSFVVPEGANGLIVQRAEKTVDSPNGSEFSSSSDVLYEAWTVENGHVTPASDAGVNDQFISGFNTDVAGKVSLEGQLQFYPGATLEDFPELKMPGEVGHALSSMKVPSSHVRPRHWTSRGAIKHSIRYDWDGSNLNFFYNTD